MKQNLSEKGQGTVSFLFISIKIEGKKRFAKCLEAIRETKRENKATKQKKGKWTHIVKGLLTAHLALSPTSSAECSHSYPILLVVAEDDVK